ncbi:MAG: TSUP family transporter [Verrucomicrobiota bacterium]|nr:TSUP family transporter [Verrucomicrobiota bacterium]
MELLQLSIFSFFAGFIDSIVGGGGLIQLPALFIFLPPSLASNIPAVLGTNKLSSICGTSAALWQYSRRLALDWKIMLPAAVVALCFSIMGAKTVGNLNPAVMRPMVIFLLLAVLIYTGMSGHLKGWRLNLSPGWVMPALLAGGAMIGFYDGFFGPGTGSFLIFGLVAFCGYEFLKGSANAKIINLATNLGAIIWFSSHDAVYWREGFVMGIFNVLGAVAGSRLAIIKGNELVRKFVIAVVLLLLARMSYEFWMSQKTIP